MKKKTENQESVFNSRLGHFHDELRWLYMELYDNSSMFAELCDNLYCFYKERGSGLKERDLKRVEHPDWYKQNDMLGMMFYIDNFAGNMPGVEGQTEVMRCRTSERYRKSWEPWRNWSI